MSCNTVLIVARRVHVRVVIFERNAFLDHLFSAAFASLSAVSLLRAGSRRLRAARRVKGKPIFGLDDCGNNGREGGRF